MQNGTDCSTRTRNATARTTDLSIGQRGEVEMLGWPGVWCMVQCIINIYMLYPAPPSAQPLTVGIIITQAGVACTHQHILHSIEIPCQAPNSKPKSYSKSLKIRVQFRLNMCGNEVSFYDIQCNGRACLCRAGGSAVCPCFAYELREAFL